MSVQSILKMFKSQRQIDLETVAIDSAIMVRDSIFQSVSDRIATMSESEKIGYTTSVARRKVRQQIRENSIHLNITSIEEKVLIDETLTLVSEYVAKQPIVTQVIPAAKAA